MAGNSNMVDVIKAKFIDAMRGLPIVVGNEIVNFSKESFNKQGWHDNTFMPWRKRKGNLKKSKGRAILVQSGRLRRSIRVTRNTGNTVVVGSDVPYAKIHNEGFFGSQSVKAHTRNRFTKSKVGTGKINPSGSERMKTVSTISGSYPVKAFTRSMNMRKRKFLGHSQYMMIRVKRVAAVYFMKKLR